MFATRCCLAALVLAGRAIGQEPGPGPGQAPVAQPILVVPAGIEFASEPYIDPNGARRRDETRLHFDEALTRVAFVGWKGGKEIGVASGAGGPGGEALLVDGYDFLSVASVPPAGQPIRFRAGKRTSKKSERWYVVAGDKKSGAEDWIGTVAVSPDGTATAWWKQPGARLDDSGAYVELYGSFQFVVNGRAGDKCEDAEALDEPQFTSDGKKVATVAKKAGKWHPLVISKKGDKTIEEKIGAGFWRVADLAWKPDGSELAFAAMDEGGSGRNRGDSESRSGDEAGGWGYAIFVGDGKDPAQTFRAAGGSCGTPVWSPDGKSVAYKVSGPPVLSGRPALGIGVDGAERTSPFATALGTPVWSPDSKRLAVAARIDPADVVRSVSRDSEVSAPDGRWFAVVEGKPGAEQLRVEDLVFSPDGSLVAYAAKEEDGWRIVVGERRSEIYDAVGAPRFTPDGKHVVFGARNGREIRREVLGVTEKDAPR